MRGMAWRVQRRNPRRFTAMVRSNTPRSTSTASVSLRIAASVMSAALACTRSTPPNASTAMAMSAPTLSSIEMSNSAEIARPPPSRMAAATTSALSAARSPTTTCAPSSPSRTAVAAPMPEPPPAITTTLSVRPRTRTSWSEAEEQGLEAPHRRPVLPAHRVATVRQSQAGEPREQRRQRHLQLDAREVRAEAVVRAVPEPQLEDVGALDVDLVRMREHRLVAVGRRGRRHHALTGVDEHATDLDVFGGEVGELRSRTQRDEAHELFDRIRHQLRLL